MTALRCRSEDVCRAVSACAQTTRYLASRFNVTAREQESCGLGSQSRPLCARSSWSHVRRNQICPENGTRSKLSHRNVGRAKTSIAPELCGLQRTFVRSLYVMQVCKRFILWNWVYLSRTCYQAGVVSFFLFLFFSRNVYHCQIRNRGLSRGGAWQGPASWTLQRARR